MEIKTHEPKVLMNEQVEEVLGECTSSIMPNVYHYYIEIKEQCVAPFYDDNTMGLSNELRSSWTQGGGPN
jgi:hypothetical protein